MLSASLNKTFLISLSRKNDTLHAAQQPRSSVGRAPSRDPLLQLHEDAAVQRTKRRPYPGCLRREKKSTSRESGPHQTQASSSSLQTRAATSASSSLTPRPTWSTCATQTSPSTHPPYLFGLIKDEAASHHFNLQPATFQIDFERTAFNAANAILDRV